MQRAAAFITVDHLLDKDGSISIHVVVRIVSTMILPKLLEVV